MMKLETTAVLIVGGGGAGLTASMLLAGQGIESLLVSALPGTSILPKAHVLNQRTMEILSDAGVAEQIYARSTPAANMKAMGWYAGFCGLEPEYGRRIGKVESWGHGGENLNWVQASACRSANLPQIRLEPIMKAHAEALNPGRVRFHHELLWLEQDEQGVEACIRNHDTGEEYRVRAKYLLGCDGGRTVGRQVGIEFEGLGAVARSITAHISADLSQLATDPDVLIRWIWSPALGEMTVLVPMGPDHWGPDSEEWVVHVTQPIDQVKDLSDAQIEQMMRSALGLGDRPITFHKISRWTLEGLLANKFRVGRVFIVGDAAHRHPPTGGLGLTSGIQDAHNLCWKLAAVLKGQADESLLDSYESERRPVDARNIQRSMENAVTHFEIGAAFGLSPSSSAEQNWQQLKRVVSGLPADATHRTRALQAIRRASMEANELNVEYGYRYESGAIVPDDSPQPQPVDEIRLYEPGTRPGSPLPHAWIDLESGERRALKDFVSPGRFLLIAGEKGEDWSEAARTIGRANDLPIDVVRIGHLEGDAFDPRLAWTQFRGISEFGAVLVRPDRVVAWRCAGHVADPAAALANALSKVLSRDLCAQA